VVNLFGFRTGPWIAFDKYACLCVELEGGVTLFQARDAIGYPVARARRILVQCRADKPYYALLIGIRVAPSGHPPEAPGFTYFVDCYLCLHPVFVYVVLNAPGRVLFEMEGGQLIVLTCNPQPVTTRKCEGTPYRVQITTK
jgi:hypothetical protein